MKEDLLAPLHDIQQAGDAIRRFVSGRGFDEYTSDELLRSAVERKFEVIGEALSRIKRDAPDLLGQIRNTRDIISFRNILVHGYDTIDDRIVWGVLEEDLGQLLEDVERLLRQPD